MFKGTYFKTGSYLESNEHCYNVQFPTQKHRVYSDPLLLSVELWTFLPGDPRQVSSLLCLPTLLSTAAGIFFLNPIISFNWILLEFGKSSDCCLFILYQEILLNFLISSKTFSVNYLGFSRHIIISFEYA